MVDEELEQVESKPVKRLCSEIQLFDLCDLETCKSKSGNFCENQEMVAKFERISEVERPVARYEDEDADDEEDCYGDGVDEDGYEDEGWEE